MDTFLMQIVPDGYINIREIKNNQVNQLFFPVEKITEYRPPKDCNVYFGVFGRSEKRGTAEYCTKTAAVWADYDDIGLAEAKQRIRDAGIPDPSVYVSSGHGIHAYWLLDKPATPDEVLPIVKGILQRTGGDMRVAEAARIMRVPGTINYNGANPVTCAILEQNNIKYAIDALRPFMTVTEPVQTMQHHNGIPELDNSERPCIRSMARGVPQGQRNFAQGRLTKYLQMKGYTKQRSLQIIQDWNRRNNPPESTDKLIRDFNAYWHGNYKLLGCMIDNPELQALLCDHCNKPDCPIPGTIDRLKIDDATKYNNRMMNDIAAITGNDLIVYGVLQIQKQLDTSQLKNWITSRATGKPCMSEKTMRDSLKRLQSMGFIETIRTSKQTGHSYQYRVIEQGTFGTGYTIISTGAIYGAIDGRVTPAEFRLYALLLKYAYHKGHCSPSTLTLAKQLDTQHPNVTRMMKHLESSGYICRNRVYPKGHERLVISLLV